MVRPSLLSSNNSSLELGGNQMSWKAKLIAIIITFLICFGGYGLLFGFKWGNLIYVILFSIIPILTILSFDSQSKAIEEEIERRNSRWYQ
jgi:hypothetical protein